MKDIVAHIFEKLGGPTAIARGTGFPVQTVHSWSEDPAEIPPWRRADILAFAGREQKLTEFSPEALAYLQSTERSVGRAAA
jgi:hypothetical protein